MPKKCKADVLAESLARLVKPQPVHVGAHRVPRHDMTVMAADVSRSAAFWDIHKHLKIAQRAKRRKFLASLLKRVSETLPGFRYYQGIHDVCLVVCECVHYDMDKALPMLRALLHAHFDRMMRDDFSESLLPLIEELQNVIRQDDPELHMVIQESGFGYHFAIPWLLTWFSHSVESFQDVCAIFDFLLHANSRDAPLLLCAAFLIKGRESVLLHQHDPCRVYQALQELVKASPVSVAIAHAKRLVNRDTTTACIPQDKRRKRRFLGLGQAHRMINTIFIGILLALLYGVLTDVIGSKLFYSLSSR